jgi:hypothetical protein
MLILVSPVVQWEGNLSRIVESIHLAKAAGARLRVGPVSRASKVRSVYGS